VLTFPQSTAENALQHQDEPTLDAIPDLLIGRTFGRFTFLRLLGRGGFGEVYLAEDSLLRRRVAVKRLSAAVTAADRRALLSEAERASSLNHPGIVTVYDVIEEGSELMLVMEYIEGSSLRTIIGAPMDLATFFAISTALADALAAAHEAGIIHCDLKPENVMLTNRTGHLKVLDFGIALTLNATQTAEQTATRQPVRGTPAYMSPEVLHGEKPSPRSDIYGLSVMLFQLLTGVHPSSVTDTATISMSDSQRLHLRELNAAVPRELELLLLRCLSARPEDRCKDAGEMLASLRRIHATMPRAERTQLIDPGPAIALRAKKKRLRIAAIAAAALLFCSLVVAGLWWRNSRPAELPAQKFVAVLPFTSPDAASDAPLAEGLAESVSSHLAELTTRHVFQVVSPAQVRALHAASPAEIAKQLGVNLLLTGSVHREGDSLTLDLTLRDAASQRKLRHLTVTRNAQSLIDIEDDALNGALKMLNLDLRSDEQTALAKQGTSNDDAHRMFLQAQGFLEANDAPENLGTAIGLFQQAIAKDPAYAKAYAGLGVAYIDRFERDHAPASLDSAQAQCDRALRIDLTSAAAHACAGRILFFRGKYEDAATQFKLALASDPASDEAYHDLARTYQQMGRAGDAEQTYLKAISIRPGYAATYRWLGAFYMDQARYQDAITQQLRATQLNPQSSQEWLYLGGDYLLAGQFSSAEDALNRSIAIRPSAEAEVNLGNAYFLQHDFASSAAAFSQATQLAPKMMNAWGGLGRAYFWLPAHQEQSRAALSRALALGEARLASNRNDSDAHTLLALYYALAGNRAQAQRNMQASLNSSAHDPETLFFAAMTANQLRESALAKQYMDQAIAAGYSRTEIAATPELASLHPPAASSASGNSAAHGAPAHEIAAHGSAAH